ncbi:GNAT family N-acetyltransferase [Kitasatospora sp. NPDC056327]|uniref:GNAT family N-acetyltransferase n=1 Tax=Kitasatospora sp. NPDC056327 TaxID=3345785 RepID=UPI0035DB2D5C
MTTPQPEAGPEAQPEAEPEAWSDAPSPRLLFLWRGDFTDPEVDALHAAAFGGDAPDPGAPTPWRARLERHSVGWVCARPETGGPLLGFVNVLWDGGVHAFLLDTAVDPAARRTGVGTLLVAAAADGARAAGCDWLHVDFEPHLRGYYLDACGFRPTDAGLLAL